MPEVKGKSIFVAFPLLQACLFLKMKALTFIVVLCCTPCICDAQSWLDSLPSGKSKQDLTLFDYQQAFEKYWASFNVTDGYFTVAGNKQKAAGWKQFRRWEYLMKLKADHLTGRLPDRSAMDVVREYERTHPSVRQTNNSAWTSMGPFSPDDDFGGVGRINCIAFHPSDQNIFWAGAASGGLWVTPDNGQTWRCLTDQNESLGISDIIISPTYEEDKTIFIATGDRDSYDNKSVGVLVSHDEGESWSSTGLNYPLKEAKFINRLLRHPENANIMIAATGDGVFKTSDGGINWDEQLTDRVFMDMEWHPSNPQIIYGSTTNGQIYRSTNDGQSWNLVLLQIQAGRTELAVSPAQPDWLYAVMSTGGLKGVFRSEDSGVTFTQTLAGDTLNLLHWNANGKGTGGQGYYDLAIAASPQNAQIIFVGGINTWRSEDGGTTWLLSNFSGQIAQADYAHADKHGLTYRPDGVLFEGNDGGIYRSDDHGNHWVDITSGMAISQMYRIGHSASEKDYVLAGLQDNGTKMTTPSSWTDVGGADGMECFIDPGNADIQFHTTQYGSLFRTLNRWMSSRYIKPNAAGEGDWLTPYAVDPSNPQTIYGGFREIWKTTNNGDSWAQVSSVNESGKFRTIAVAPSDPNIIYAAGPYEIYRSTTGGEPFVEVEGLLPNQSNSISRVVVQHDNPDVVWITSSSFFSPGIFESKDGGNSWTDISEGIPPIPIYCVVQNIQVEEVIALYAGTELGVYYKHGDAPWTPYKNGLPNVIVMDLEIYYDSDPAQSLLRAGTYGRGMWETRMAFDSSPMSFIAATTSHPTFDPIKPGFFNQPILKLEIQTSGDLNPLQVQSFHFSTTGSTSPFEDISAARLFYTGNVNGFIPSTPVGEIIQQPNGTFVIHGPFGLGNGINHFWLTYDLPQTANEGHVLDAVCDSFYIDSTLIPEITAPDSNRLIEVVYCASSSTHLSSEHISRVIMGTIDRSSAKGTGGYEDHSGLVHEATAGVPFAVSVQNSSPHNTNALLVWIDYNRDGDFEDNGEEVFNSGPGFVPVYTFEVTPLEDVREDFTLMRFRLHDTSFGPNATPCGTSNLGEVEDYGIRIIEDMMSAVDPVLKTEMLFIDPNPFKQTLYIRIGDVHENVSGYITDVNGKIVFEGDLYDQCMIDLSHVADGCYFLYAAVGDGIWKKLIKSIR